MLRRHRIRALFVSLITACGLGLPSMAGALTFEFEGMVTELGRDGGLFGAAGSVNIGDSFTGRVTYEVGPGNPDLDPGDTEVGAYVLTSLEIDQSVVALTPTALTILHRPPGSSLPPAPPVPGRDWFFARASAPTYASYVALVLQGPFGSAFSDDSLPLSLDLADFTDGVSVVGLQAAGIAPNPSIHDLGTITRLSLVPEPSASALVASIALLGLALRAIARRGHE